MNIVKQVPSAAGIPITSSLSVSPFLVSAGEPGAGSAVNLGLPGSGSLNETPFTVRAAGYIFFRLRPSRVRHYP
jgi:hypothetical protein